MRNAHTLEYILIDIFLDDNDDIEELIGNDFQVASLDFSPFKSKIHALVYFFDELTLTYCKLLLGAK